MKKEHSIVRICVLLAVYIMTIISCGGSGIGYGVVLWSPDEEQLMTGQKYIVKSKSDIQGTYEVALPDKKGVLKVDQWRIEYFPGKSEAEEYMKSHAEYVDLYARAEEDRFTIRDKPSINGRQIYVARYREVMKIIRKTDIQETIGNYDGFWYEVLTDDGTRGYRFGLNLNVYDIKTAVEEEEFAREMAQIRRVLDKVYRTQYTADLVNAGTVDLEQIKSAFGFFPDPSAKELKIITKDYRISAVYESINYLGVINGAKRFSFEGANIQISVHNDNLITLHFSYNRREHGDRYIYIENLNDIIADEELRRAEVFQSIYEKGSPLKSGAYGTITLMEDRTFNWSNFDVLVPDVLKAGTGHTGWISIDKFMVPSLRGSYDGALTFNFNTGQKVVFTYELNSNGIRLVHIPERIIEDNFVSSDPAVKRVAFFNFP
jgi:hypothetical protein